MQRLNRGATAHRSAGHHRQRGKHLPGGVGHQRSGIGESSRECGRPSGYLKGAAVHHIPREKRRPEAHPHYFAGRIEHVPVDRRGPSPERHRSVVGKPSRCKRAVAGNLAGIDDGVTSVIERAARQADHPGVRRESAVHQQFVSGGDPYQTAGRIRDRTSQHERAAGRLDSASVADSVGNRAGSLNRSVARDRDRPAYKARSRAAEVDQSAVGKRFADVQRPDAHVDRSARVGKVGVDRSNPGDVSSRHVGHRSGTADDPAVELKRAGVVQSRTVDAELVARGQRHIPIVIVRPRISEVEHAVGLYELGVVDEPARTRERAIAADAPIVHQHPGAADCAPIKLNRPLVV